MSEELCMKGVHAGLAGLGGSEEMFVAGGGIGGRG